MTFSTIFNSNKILKENLSLIEFFKTYKQFLGVGRLEGSQSMNQKKINTLLKHSYCK